MAKLLENKGLFEGIDRKKKEEIVGQPISIKAYIPMKDLEGKSYAIMLCQDQKGKEFTTTASEIILNKLVDAAKAIGLDEEKSDTKRFYYAEPLENIIITKTKSTKNKRDFYNIENAEDTE